MLLNGNELPAAAATAASDTQTDDHGVWDAVEEEEEEEVKQVFYYATRIHLTLSLSSLLFHSFLSFPPYLAFLHATDPSVATESSIRNKHIHTHVYTETAIETKDSSSEPRLDKSAHESKD